MPQTPDIPEGLDLRKDGTVFLHVDKPTGEGTDLVRLRRPKMRELKELRQAEWDVSDEVLGWIDTNNKVVIDLRLEAAEKPDDRELAVRIRNENIRINRESATINEDLRLRWAADVVEMLNGRELDPADLPPWMGSTQFASDLIGHWFAVPTRRGGQ